MTSKTKDDYWRTTGILRHITRNKLQQEILLSGFMISKTASEIENNFYVHARTREEFLTYNARLILNLREMKNKELNNVENRLLPKTEDIICELIIVIETRAINDIISELNYLYMTALDEMNDTNIQSLKQNSENKVSDSNIEIIDISEDSNNDNLAQNISLQSQNMTRKIWCGLLEFQIKRVKQSSMSSSSKRTILNFTLNCEIFAKIIRNGEPELNARQWPQKLLLSIISSQVIAQLLPILCNKSHHLGMNFVCNTSDNEFTFAKLTNIMSQNFCGFIQFNAESNVRIMIVMYMSKRKVFIGFVPYDQNQFFHAIKRLIDRKRTIDQRFITRRSISLPNPNCNYDVNYYKN